jgi:hypothetical protein
MDDQTDIFVATDEGPPKRRFWIPRDAEAGPKGSIRGWVFNFDEWRDGDWQMGWDTWERWFCEIIRYPSDYASRDLEWRRFADGTVVNLDALQQDYDRVRVAPEDPVPGHTAVDLVQWIAARRGEKPPK